MVGFTTAHVPSEKVSGSAGPGRVGWPGSSHERTIDMNPYILCFQEIDTTKLALVGGKGANLGELSRIEGIQVPQGFCVTTEAYQEIVGKNEKIQSLLDRLSLLKA